jgi:hypothetical protein
MFLHLIRDRCFFVETSFIGSYHFRTDSKFSKLGMCITQPLAPPKIIERNAWFDGKSEVPNGSYHTASFCN